MIKADFPVMKEIVKVFDILLKAGQFPASCTEGIIVSIHKKGSCADPNNYRGLPINSCFGKLVVMC